MMPLIFRLWAELMRPSTLPPGPLHSAYERGVIGMAHALLGAALVAVLGPWLGAAIRFAIGLAYAATKERADLRHGGTLLDGIEDAAMVAGGAWFWGAWYWPILVLIWGGALMVSGAARHVD